MASNTKVHMEYHQAPNPKDESLLMEGINAEAIKIKGMQGAEPLGIFLKNESGVTLGGLTGVTMYGSLYIDMLWVDSQYRSNGWGRELVLEAERIAKERKCHFATLNTMDWEALSFYKKLGFFIEFTREGYDQGSKMYLLRKSL